MFSVLVMVRRCSGGRSFAAPLGGVPGGAFSFEPVRPTWGSGCVCSAADTPTAPPSDVDSDQLRAAGYWVLPADFGDAKPVEVEPYVDDGPVDIRPVTLTEVPSAEYPATDAGPTAHTGGAAILAAPGESRSVPWHNRGAATTVPTPTSITRVPTPPPPVDPVPPPTSTRHRPVPNLAAAHLAASRIVAAAPGAPPRRPATDPSPGIPSPDLMMAPGG